MEKKNHSAHYLTWFLNIGATMILLILLFFSSGIAIQLLEYNSKVVINFSEGGDAETESEKKESKYESEYEKFLSKISFSIFRSAVETDPNDMLALTISSPTPEIVTPPPKG